MSSAGSALALDDRRTSVSIATWIGPPNTAILDAYFAWLHRILDASMPRRAPFTVINDASSVGLPNAAARARLADHTRGLRRSHPDLEAYYLRAPVVISSPLLRGATAALAWLVGPSFQIEWTDTCGSAITTMRDRFAARGAKWPEELSAETYRRPELGS